MVKKVSSVLAVCLGIAVSTASLKAQTWFNLGGTTMPNRGMAVTDRVISSQDYLDVYAVWNDGSVRVDGQSFSCRNRSGHPICGPFFTGWTNLGGDTNFPPAAVGWGNHREVFIIRSDSQLWHNSTENSSWSGWQPLGAPASHVCSGPTAASWAPGRIDVFVQGCDRNLWHAWFDHGWHGWEVPQGSGQISTAPTAVSSENGSIEVVAADSSGEVHAIACGDSLCNDAQSASWGAWEDTGLGGCATPAAAPVFLGPGVHLTYSAFIESCNVQQLLGSVRNGGWQPPVANTAFMDRGGISPRAVLASNFINYVFYLDPSGHVAYHNWLNNRWLSQGDNAIGSDTFMADPVPVAGSIAVFIVAAKSDGSIWYTFIDPASPPDQPRTFEPAAWTGSSYGQVGLHHFGQTQLVTQDFVPPGYYLVNAKTVINNADGDYQDAECQLLAEDFRHPQNPPVVVDDARVRVGKSGEGDTQAVALRGYFIGSDTTPSLAPPYRFRFTCATYNGSAAESVLTVIQVPDINFSDGNTAYVAEQDSTPLGHFVQTQVASFFLSPGNYLIHAKGDLQNNDGDDQNAHCSLIATSLASTPPATTMIDYTNIRPQQAQHSDRLSVSMQSAFCTGNSSGKIELECDTYNGAVRHAVLTATPVNSACPE
jgi:hypothetical protein